MTAAECVIRTGVSSLLLLSCSGFAEQNDCKVGASAAQDLRSDSVKLNTAVGYSKACLSVAALHVSSFINMAQLHQCTHHLSVFFFFFFLSSVSLSAEVYILLCSCSESLLILLSFEVFVYYFRARIFLEDTLRA